MKVENMTSSSGNKVANQFIIGADERHYFQSYKSIIVYVPVGVGHVNKAGIIWDHQKIHLDRHFWDYSKTTSTYRNIFLGETTKETQAKINSGEYILADLN